MSNELTTTNTNAFSALENFNLTEALSDELACLDASFERIKIPIGGSTIFEIPSDDPEQPETVKEFSAVILYQHALYAYYIDEYTGGSNPPDCGSFDGIIGTGNPGGECKHCPNNVFGSGKNGAKSCKNRRRIFLLREGELFPLILLLPTGSLKEFTRYIQRLMSKRRRSNSVVTRFTLKKATSNSGVPYTQVQFAVDRVLAPEEYALISTLSEQVKEYSKNVAFEDDTDGFRDIDPETGELPFD